MNSIVDTKFFMLFSTLDYSSSLEFIDYLKVKTFNPSAKILTLVNTINSKTRTVDKVLIYSSVFPNEDFNDAKLRNLLSRSYNLLLSFLSTEQIKEDTSIKRQLELKVLHNSQNKKLASDGINRWEKELSKNGSSESLQEKMLFEKLKYEYTLTKLSAENRLSEASSDEYNLSLDEYFILSKLQLFITSLNYKSVAGIQENFTFYNEVLKYVEDNPASHPLIRINYAILLCYIDSSNEANYQQLISLLKDKGAYLATSTQRQSYLHAQNYCIRQFNQGNSKYLNELMTVYQLMIANGSILEDGKLSQWSYKNIVGAGLRANQKQWTLDFIESHKEFVPPQFQEAAYSFNLANYYFYNQQYKKAIPLLQEVDYTDIFYLLGSKVMLLKIFFETDEHDAMVSLIDSFTQFLKRRKGLTENHRKNHQNFIRFLKRVVALNKKDIRKLTSEIANSTNVTDRAWLINKVEELQ